MICYPEVTVLLFHLAGTLVSLAVSNGASPRFAKTVSLMLSRHIDVALGLRTAMQIRVRTVIRNGAGCGGFTSLIHPSAAKLVSSCINSWDIFKNVGLTGMRFNIFLVPFQFLYFKTFPIRRILI